MEVDGQCLCGSLKYRATVDPDRVIVCHCTDCQINSASAFGVVVVVTDGDFEFLSGTPRVYVKTADSGNKRALAFCGDCGTRIHATTVEGDNPMMGLRVGSVRQRAQLIPNMQAWTGSALPWAHDLNAIPEFSPTG